jgi:putative transcriptional regulator
LKLLVALLACGAIGAAAAQDLDRPLMLVAVPELQGPYNHTALIVVPAGEGVHFGFIINRATGVKMATLFPEHAPSAKVVDPVYFGGPEMVGSIFAVVRNDPGAHAVPLFGDLYVTADADVVDRIIEKTPNDARYFAGFVGWQPGELAAELEAGYWSVSEPDATLLFRHDTGGLWDELRQRLEMRRRGI